MCNGYIEHGFCPYGVRCQFAHSHSNWSTLASLHGINSALNISSSRAGINNGRLIKLLQNWILWYLVKFIYFLSFSLANSKIVCRCSSSLIMIVFSSQIFLSFIKYSFFKQRKEKEMFKETTQTYCLVCDLHRNKLEKIYEDNPRAFQMHVYHSHSVYHYFCYLNYIQHKPLKNKIIEKNVWKMHCDKNFFFLPKSTCFKLKMKQ